MTAWIFKRLMHAMAVVVGTGTLVFLGIRCLPGDPALLMLGVTADPTDVAALREKLGLHLPIWKQYQDFLLGLFRGNWGESFLYSKPVLGIVLERLWPTCVLALLATVVGVFVGWFLGLTSALGRDGVWDRSVRHFAVVISALPIFLLGPLGIAVFAVQLRWLPVSGWDSPLGLVLPVFCLSLGVAAVSFRHLRVLYVTRLSMDFVRAARARSIPPLRLYLLHVMKHGASVWLPVLSLMFGALLSGSPVTETVFDWPGLGTLFVAAFQSRDYVLVQGIVVLVCVSQVSISFALDLCLARLDPRTLFDSGEQE